MMRKYTFRIILIAVLCVFALASVVLVATRAPEPMPQAMAALQSDGQVVVDAAPWLTFRPRSTEAAIGLIFYPGGLVDPRAYAPMARNIAAQGYLVVIVPMPLNLAFFDSSRASDVIARYPTIKRWAIGGHSLGGVAAAMFVKSHPVAVHGLVFWASYPADSMRDSQVAVSSIYGTQDGLSTPAKIDASRALLPATAKFVAIEGGNHGQFGWYGLQSGDGVATISREQQQAQIVAATIDLLKQIGN
ncbi:MAG TPA: alpha/beta hydrolase [Anaerolineae bacterium]